MENVVVGCAKNGCVNIRTFCPMKKASSHHHDQRPCYLEAPPILPYRRTSRDSCGGCAASDGLSPQIGPGPDQAFDEPRQAFAQASLCASAPLNTLLSLHLHRHRLIFSTGSKRGRKREGFLDTIRSSSLSNNRSLLRRMWVAEKSSIPVDIYSGPIFARRPILLPILKPEKPNDKVVPSIHRPLADWARPET
jgi:hypothetical protein